jgi:circadian clock protein KaiC
MITSETSSLGPTTETVGGLSFLYHNVVLLRYIEQGSEVGRAVAILKMRDSDHEKGLRTFKIGSRGFEVEAKLQGVTGLLGWSALRGQETRGSDRRSQPPDTGGVPPGREQ